MTKNTLSLIAMGLVLAAGCKTMTGETAGQNVDDATITTSVKSKLATQEQMGTLTQISVKTVADTVYLTGIAKTQQEREHAGEIAAKVDGVKKVVNNIEVGS